MAGLTLKESVLKLEEADVRAEVKIPCEVYSRIVGYIRPVQNWHQGKQQEFSERKTFEITERIGD